MESEYEQSRREAALWYCLFGKRCREHNNQSGRSRERPMSLYERRMVWLTVGIAIITAIYAIFSYEQWSVMRDTLSLERPWLGRVRVAVATKHDNPSAVVDVQWTFTNAGRSPAVRIASDLKLKLGAPLPYYNVSTEQQIGKLQAPEPPADCLNICVPIAKEGFTDVPGVETTIDIPAPMEIFNADQAIAKNQRGLYLVGCLDYMDSTAKPYLHRLHILEYYTTANGNFRPASNGNYESECQRPA